MFYVPIHIGALIADYGGCLLCGPRWRSSIELIRGALGLIRRRQNSARQLICRISNFRLARGVPQAIQALQAISKVIAGVALSIIGISPVDFVQSLEEIAHATGHFVVPYCEKSQRVPPYTPMTNLTSII